MEFNNMNHDQLVDYICEWYNKHFSWRCQVYGEEIDRSLVNSMSDTELRNFIRDNCK